MVHSGQLSATMCVVAASVGRSLGHNNVACTRVPVSGLGLVLSFTSGLFSAACQWTLGSGDAWVSVSFLIHGFAVQSYYRTNLGGMCFFVRFPYSTAIMFVRFLEGDFGWVDDDLVG